ncbi:MAG TPA: ATP-binding protein [Myxococcota bacterium]
MATAFAPTADPRAYVPYAGAERVLAALEEWVRDPERPVRVLRGPEGSGKSLLLAVLGARVGRHALPVAVSARGLDPDALARRVLDALGASFEGRPRVALARRAGELGGRRVLLLIDDADALAPRTEMWLFDFVRRGAGALHALLAVRDERMAGDLASAFQSGTEVIVLDTPMRREEAEAWVRAELARSGVPEEVRARFDAATLARLHSGSGGWPGALRAQAEALVAEAARSSAAAVAAAEGAALEADRAARAAEPAPAAPRPEAGSSAALPPAAAGASASEAPPVQRAAGDGPRARGDAAATPQSAPDGAGRAGAALQSAPNDFGQAGATAHRAPQPAAAPANETPAPAARAARRTAAAGEARGEARPAAGKRSAPTRNDVDRDAPRRATFARDGLLRWLLLPAALAAAYVAGFLSSQALETLRERANEAPALAAAPPPGAPEAAAPSQRDPFASPPPGPGATAGDPADATRSGGTSTAPDDAREAPGDAALLPPVAAAPRTAAGAPGAPAHAPEPGRAAGSAARPEEEAAASAAAAAPAARPQRELESATQAAEPDAAAEADPRPESEPSATAAARPARAARSEGGEARRQASRPAEPERPEAPRRVSVNVQAEPGASIVVDGQPVGSGTVQGLPLAPGPHRFEIWLPDGRVVERVVEVRGTRFNVTVR